VIIGVISDTHVHSEEELDTIKEIFSKYFSSVDLLLHAGDLVNLNVYDWLNKQVKTIAVSGNMDYPEVTDKFPQKRIIEADKFRIGLIHGWGPPSGLTARIQRAFIAVDGTPEVDCIVFGHTHSAFNKTIDGLLFFNPGAPIDRRFAAYNSIGFLKIDSKIEGTIEKI